MTRNIDDPARLNGTPVIGGDGEKLGSVDAVYYDNATEKAEWVAVRSGLFGTRVTLVPLCSADYSGERLRVPFDRAQLRNAPHPDPGRELSASAEADLYRYYGLDVTETPDAGPDAAVPATTGPVDTAVGGPVDTAGGGPVDTAAGGPVDTAAGGPVDTAAGGPVDTAAGGPSDTATEEIAVDALQDDDAGLRERRTL